MADFPVTLVARRLGYPGVPDTGAVTESLRESGELHADGVHADDGFATMKTRLFTSA